MELLSEFLVRVRLDTKSFPYGEDLEEKRKLATISFTDFGRNQCPVILDHIKQGTLGSEVLRGKRRMSAHPQL